MRSFPAFFELRGAPVLLVGGGAAAVAKYRLLAQAGAAVVCVAPQAEAGLAGADLTWHRRGFRPEDVAGMRLVISATGVPAVDEAVAAAAEARAIPVNVVDRPALCSFTVPAMIDRDPVTIAISTGGAAPVLAQWLRARIETLLPARLGALAALAGRFRDRVAAALPAAARRGFWRAFIGSDAAHAVLAGDETGADRAMVRLLNHHRAGSQGRSGKVILVGAGPGDPDLLTLKAVQALQDADVIIHDRLVNPVILDRARRDAQRIYVGKAKGRHSRPQAEINALLAHHAGRGKIVVRLKGGDPFLFGRGGEELDYLRKRGVTVEVVPGITAATACAAGAGIPLTHRGVAQGVTFVTGHAREGEPALDWPALAQSALSLAVYMGITHGDIVARKLIAHGRAPDTPVAVIENGSLPDQRTVTGTLAGLGELLQGERIESPALIVIGPVVAVAAGSVEAAPAALAG